MSGVVKETLYDVLSLSMRKNGGKTEEKNWKILPEWNNWVD